MSFWRFALNNLRRNQTRTVLTILSVAAACATLTTVLSLDKGYRSAVNDELVVKAGAHLYITREGCPMEAASIIAQGGISPLYVPASVMGKLEKVGGIETMMPFNIFALTTEDGSRTDIFMGITKALEKVRPDLTFVEGGWFTAADSIVLGAEMARLEKREIGDKVYFEQFDREFTVSGVLKRTYGQDDGMFFLPIEVAQELIDRRNKLSAIALKLSDVSALSDIRTRIRSMLPGDYYVISSRELGDGVLAFFGSTRVIMLIMVVVAFAVSIIGVVNTKLMTITERKKEIAYLKCVGAGAYDIVRLISLETLVMSFAGTVVGLGVGLSLAPWFERLIKDHLVVYVPSAPIVRPDAAIIALASLMVIVVGVAASLYPAIRAARIRPMEVLRDE